MSHSSACACVQCTAQRITDNSQAAAALTVANLALRQVYDLLLTARTVAEHTHDTVRAANDRARKAGRIPSDERVIAVELARQEANRAHAARELLPLIGGILEGSTDLDTTAVGITFEPRDTVEGRSEGGRDG